MVYRYKLKDNKHNKGIQGRTINQVKLFKNRWLVSETPINFRTFEHMIESEEAEDSSQFHEKDEYEQREPIEHTWFQSSEYDEAGVMNAISKITEEEREVEETDYEDEDIAEAKEEKEMLDMLYEELYQTAISHGFLEDEIDLFSESEDTLKYLLLLETEVEEDEGSV